MGEVVSPLSRKYAAGDDLLLTFTVVDDAGTAVDISGFTGKFHLSRRRGSTAVVSSENSPADVTIDMAADPTNGIFTVAIDQSVTDPLLGDYYLEAKVIDGSSDKVTVTRGYITFIAAND